MAGAPAPAQGEGTSHSSAAHHVRLREMLSYDEGGHQLRIDSDACKVVLLKHREFEAVSYAQGPAGSASAPPVVCSNDGPVLDVRFSGERWVAIQRSAVEVELRDLRTGFMISHAACLGRPAKGGRILGMHWLPTGSPCHLLVVGTWGAEFLVVRPQPLGLKVVKKLQLDVSWYVYSQEARLVLLATGPQDNAIQGIQVQPTAFARVPKFVVALPTPAFPGESTAVPPPPPPQHSPFSAPSCRRGLRRDDVTVACLYGRLFLAHADEVNLSLVLYEIFHDVVIRRHRITLPSPRVGVSAVDSLLLVHDLRAGVCLIYDLQMNTSQPVTAPLPPGMGPDEPRAPALDQLLFLSPGMAIHLDEGRVFLLDLDHDAIVTSSVDRQALVRFLRGRASADAANALRRVWAECLSDAVPLRTLRPVAELLVQGGRARSPSVEWMAEELHKARPRMSTAYAIAAGLEVVRVLCEAGYVPWARVCTCTPRPPPPHRATARPLVHRMEAPGVLAAEVASLLIAGSKGHVAVTLVRTGALVPSAALAAAFEEAAEVCEHALRAAAGSAGRVTRMRCARAGVPPCRAARRGHPPALRRRPQRPASRAYPNLRRGHHRRLRRGAEAAVALGGRAAPACARLGTRRSRRGSRRAGAVRGEECCLARERGIPPRGRLRRPRPPHHRVGPAPAGRAPRPLWRGQRRLKAPPTRASHGLPRRVTTRTSIEASVPVRL